MPALEHVKIPDELIPDELSCRRDYEKFQCNFCALCFLFLGSVLKVKLFQSLNLGMSCVERDSRAHVVLTHCCGRLTLTSSGPHSN